MHPVMALIINGAEICGRIEMELEESFDGFSDGLQYTSVHTGRRVLTLKIYDPHVTVIDRREPDADPPVDPS